VLSRWKDQRIGIAKIIAQIARIGSAPKTTNGAIKNNAGKTMPKATVKDFPYTAPLAVV
jgi:hypothetical protein